MNRRPYINSKALVSAGQASIRKIQLTNSATIDSSIEGKTPIKRRVVSTKKSTIGRGHGDLLGKMNEASRTRKNSTFGGNPLSNKQLVNGGSQLLNIMNTKINKIPPQQISSSNPSGSTSASKGTKLRRNTMQTSSLTRANA